MKSLQILVLYLWAGFFGVHAQQNKRVDSLKTTLESLVDTSRVNVLIELASEVRFTDPAQSEKYATEALALAEKYVSLLGQARAKRQLCRSFAERGDYATAVKLALQALESYEKVGDQHGARDMFTSVGIINRYQKNHRQSLEYFQSALDLTIELGEREPLAGIYGNMGNVYYDLEKYDLAKESHLLSLKIDQEFDHQPGVAVTFINLGKLEKVDGNFSTALGYFTKSLELNQNLENIRNIALCYSQISETYLKMKNGGMALAYANKSLAMAHQNQSLRLKQGALEQLINVHQHLGNFRTALGYNKSLGQVKDSIFNQEQSKQFTELQTKYETEKKEQQIASQENEIALLEEKKASDRKLMVSLIALAVTLILLVGFVYGRYRLKRRSERQLRNKNKEIAVMNQELERKALRAQMDPHFIFNSMNSIQHFITTNDKTSALKYLSKFSKLIRQILENSVNHQVPIADEIKLLEYYIQLEALRFDEQFEHQIEIDDSLDIYDTEIPFLLIQPYVENAIIHGLNHKDEKGHLKVRLQDQQKHILCTVEDDGVGREKAAQLKKEKHYISRGMNVTSRRLELLNRDKKNKTLVEVEDLYDKNQQVIGTKVEIKIPLDVS